MNSVRPGRNPVAVMGLALVAWSRATEWSRMAFKSLPSLGDFLAIRQSREFRRREQFERDMDSLHEVHMASLGLSPEQEIEEHIKHLQGRVRHAHGEKVRPEEIAGLKAQ